MQTTMQRYSNGAIILHWVTALLMIYMLFLGEDLIKVRGSTSLADSNGSIHATLGMTILVLTIVRLLWRLAKPSPAPAAGLKSWEVTASKLGHIAFYMLLIGLPISGWLALTPYAAQHGGGETLTFFNLFPAMVMPDVGGWIGDVHEIGSKLGIALLAVHVLGALKHQFFDKMPFLQRMKPF